MSRTGNRNSTRKENIEWYIEQEVGLESETAGK